MNLEPLAFFITWTVYGTFLQGDLRGWRKRGSGHQLPEPRLMNWRESRLKHRVLLLNEEQRECVRYEIQRHCDHRKWSLRGVAIRSNHVHVVVAANESGSKVRDQLKANCTRGLRSKWPVFLDRDIWTHGGDWQCVNDEEGLERVLIYTTEAQDRKWVGGEETAR
jgi:REP element-mobilizing transposase RayT